LLTSLYLSYLHTPFTKKKRKKKTWSPLTMNKSAFCTANQVLILEKKMKKWNEEKKPIKEEIERGQVR
jgi:hypothetical protein